MSNRSLFRLILCSLLLAAVARPAIASQPPVHSHRAFKIGVLVSFTGSWSSLGQNTVAALPLAADQLDADAIVALMWHDGIHTIVPLWRNDAGNNGLHDSVKADFEKLGGTVTAGYQYQPPTTDFSAATTSVTSQIGTLLTTGTNPESIAIY